MRLIEDAGRFLTKLRGYPPIFRGRDGALSAVPPGAFVVAHNAGDRLAAARASVAARVDVVEIDLIMRRGRLLVGHPRDAWIFSRILLPTLDPEAAWAEASRAPAVKLDLKEESPAFVRLALQFASAHEGSRLMIVTRSASVVEAFAREAPWVLRALSVSAESLARLRQDEALLRLVDGVSGHPDRFDAATIAWLRERGLFSMSSVVNTFALAERLLAAGVCGMITDNLALMEAIGGRGGIDTLDWTRERKGAA